MEWFDKGIVVSVRPHGETSAIVNILTEERGRCCGYVKGAQSKKMRPVLDLGNEVEARWFSRVEENLGHFTLELLRPHASLHMGDYAKLSAVQAGCALIDRCLPEREQHLSVYEGFRVFLESLDSPVWAETYIFWEMALLKELGFGLDLKKCAAGGDNDELAYVSPKTGRAVSLSAGEPYKERLLKLPSFLAGKHKDDPMDILHGLQLTGYFLQNRVFAHTHQEMPEARGRLLQKIAREYGTDEESLAKLETQNQLTG